MNIFDELDLRTALAEELDTPNRLLPPRPDLAALDGEIETVQRLFRANAARPNGWGTRADVVFADKTKGSRPLSVLTLQDRVLYRALVKRLAESLPDRVVTRGSYADFARAPLDTVDSQFVASLDVSSYFVYVDHELLIDELVAQTGDIAATETLGELLVRVMGRRIGLPQISWASDVLGDTHLDRVFRRLTRQGFAVSRFADDFRIATATLEDARRAIEACSAELYSLGLMLNTDKTFTYSISKYRDSLTLIEDAERALFVDEDDDDEFVTFFLQSTNPYVDETPADSTDDRVEEEDVASLDPSPAVDVDDAEAIGPLDDAGAEPTERIVRAARRAWDLWNEHQEENRGVEAAVVRTLVFRALRVLGRADDESPLTGLRSLMENEPALSTEVAAYLQALPSRLGRRRARAALNELLEGPPPLSTWQKIWIAHAAGRIRRVRTNTAENQVYLAWLEECLTSDSDALVATAASSLGRLRIGDPDQLAAAADRVGPQWRSLALWGLARVDRERALTIADGRLERTILGQP